MQVSPQAVAMEVIRQGGDKWQALVAAALVSGVESNGDPTELSGGVGPAAGLFQFEPGTWLDNGGGKFAPVAQDATWQQQVTVFLNDTAGDNFHSWGPDVVAAKDRGDPNSSSNPAYGYTGLPQTTSAVQVAVSGLSGLGFLGNLPTGWADAGAATPANPAPGPLGAAAGFFTGGTSSQGPLSGLSGLESGVDAVLTDITSASWWKRIGLFTTGVVFIVGGIILFVSTTKTGQRVEGAAELAAVA